MKTAASIIKSVPGMIEKARCMSTAPAGCDPIDNWANYFQNVLSYYGLTGTGNINDDCYTLYSYLCDAVSVDYEDKSAYDVLLGIYDYFFDTHSTRNQAPSLFDYLQDFYGNLKDSEYDITSDTLFNWSANHNLRNCVDDSLGAATGALPDVAYGSPNWHNGFYTASDMYLQWAAALPTVSDFNDLTIRSLIKRGAGATVQVIVNYGDYFSENGAFVLGLNADEKPFVTVYSDGAATTVTSADALSADTLYQLKAVCDGTDLYLYVDGVQKGTDTIVAMPFLSNTDGVFCGRDLTAEGGGDYPFLGRIYGIAIDNAVI